MPVTQLKVLGNDGIVATINNDNPVPVTLVAGGAAAGDVNVTDRVGREIGLAGSYGITIAQTPTVTAGAYTANDNLGGLLTFANACRVAGYGGVIKSMVIVDDASQSGTIELWLFNQTFTAGADNAVWTPVEAELENLVGIISTTDGIWYTGGATATVNVTEASLRYDSTGTSLFGRLVTRTADTYVATDDVTVVIGLLQD